MRREYKVDDNASAWKVTIGPQECIRCEARALRKPEAYMMAYGEDFRRVIIPPLAGQMMYERKPH